MSLHQFDCWVCDLCERAETTPRGEFMRGWRWYRVGSGRIGHACPACSVLVIEWAPIANATTAPLG